MRKFLTVALMSLMLPSCSALDAVNLLNPDKPSIEVNANVGKNVSQEKSNLKFEQGTKDVRQEADVISNDTRYTAENIKQITQNIPIEFLLLAVLLGGWAIPSPKETYRGGKVVIADIFNAIIVSPLRGVKDIILTFKK